MLNNALKTAFDLVTVCARKWGVAISHYPPPGTYERRLRDYLSQMEINLVLDVGACTGNYVREIRDVGYRGRIISFEPVPASYAQLCAGMQHDALWSSQPYGLSDENREAVINTYGKSNFNSLLTLRADAERAYSMKPERRGQTQIQLRRLDSVLPQLIEGIRSPRIFMKLDTQGHDVSVVKGGSAVLDLIVGLQSELPAVQIYEGMLSMSAALEYYASCGFVPIGFHPVNTLRDIQISPEFDVLFSRFEGKLSPA